MRRGLTGAARDDLAVVVQDTHTTTTRMTMSSSEFWIGSIPLLADKATLASGTNLLSKAYPFGVLRGG